MARTGGLQGQFGETSLEKAIDPLYLTRRLGWYGIWGFQVIFRLSETCWVMLEMKAGLLSDCRVRGRPNLGMICWRAMVATTSAVSRGMEKVPIHRVKVSTKANR